MGRLSLHTDLLTSCFSAACVDVIVLPDVGAVVPHVLLLSFIDTPSCVYIDTHSPRALLSHICCYVSWFYGGVFYHLGAVAVKTCRAKWFLTDPPFLMASLRER